VRKPKDKREHEKLRHGFEDNNKVDLKEVA
jgi:hypothetical protein